ncbi:hypothetical protein GALMADRAFT_454146 [Galerina marginata CBS 339.88]|uniref:Uncharacterized protein n=1 Tax=Galerina marginata (strain CBS 339.88) TaxID=685588 RepID=A0A067T367_GALM3|nr:hypothetical protein GALMADRAFT_454146 [Galerina marginata CBS 339.88]
MRRLWSVGCVSRAETMTTKCEEGDEVRLLFLGGRWNDGIAIAIAIGTSAKKRHLSLSHSIPVRIPVSTSTFKHEWYRAQLNC